MEALKSLTHVCSCGVTKQQQQSLDVCSAFELFVSLRQLQLAFAAALRGHEAGTGTIKWSRLAMVWLATVPRCSFLSGQNLKQCKKCRASLAVGYFFLRQ